MHDLFQRSVFVHWALSSTDVLDTTQVSIHPIFMQLARGHSPLNSAKLVRSRSITFNRTIIFKLCECALRQITNLHDSAAVHHFKVFFLAICDLFNV